MNVKHAQEHRYVRADGGPYGEYRIVVIPRGNGNALVYEGDPAIRPHYMTAPVFDGPLHLATRYAADREADFLSNGFVAIQT